MPVVDAPVGAGVAVGAEPVEAFAERGVGEGGEGRIPAEDVEAGEGGGVVGKGGIVGEVGREDDGTGEGVVGEGVVEKGRGGGEFDRGFVEGVGRGWGGGAAGGEKEDGEEKERKGEERDAEKGGWMVHGGMGPFGVGE